VTLGAAAQNGAGAFAPLPSSCGGAPCEWLATENGYNGEYNNVTPRFWSGSLLDTFDPTDRLHLNVGVRYDNYGFIPSGTETPGSQFWFNAWNNEMCYNKANPGSAVVALPSVTAASNASNGGCATLGSSYVQAHLSDSTAPASFPVWQPRAGLTYSLSPRDVLRASYGRYDQAPNTAFEEYDTFQQDLPDYLGPTFFAYGRTSPTYPIAPEISNNYDLSWEHEFKGTDWSTKITPFYRSTQDQIEQFYLNVTANFVSGLNIGRQTNRGVEFDLQKGDFSRNGLSGMFAFTYTNAYVNYANLSNGNSVLSYINGQIKQFNAYTSGCANNKAAASECGTTATGVAAAPCYAPIPAGSPAGTLGTPESTCTAGDVANPYWNMAPQGLFSSSGNYWPYDLFPAGPGAGSYNSFVTPYTATVLLNYKHDKFAITPALQVSAGNRYGYPLSESGYDPANCGTPTSVPITSAWYATAGGSGSAANPATCNSTINIPDIATGHFDGIGAFVNPARFTLSAQLSYDVSPRITAVLTLANIVDSCLGGTSAAWTRGLVGFPSSAACVYGTTTETENGAPPGNINAISSTGAQLSQPLNAYAYSPQTSSTLSNFGSGVTLPFSAYLDFRIKL
jgi:outer membrane receptor protein involved in Fe transport